LCLGEGARVHGADTEVRQQRLGQLDWRVGEPVLGRSLGGIEPIQFTSGTISSAIGRLTSNVSWSAWLDTVSKTDGAPPAPSTNAIPYRAATAEAGPDSSEENGPKARSTCFWPNRIW
jgi:hypothetical protein